jgi:hypothetical protein
MYISLFHLDFQSFSSLFSKNFKMWSTNPNKPTYAQKHSARGRNIRKKKFKEREEEFPQVMSMSPFPFSLFHTFFSHFSFSLF